MEEVWKPVVGYETSYLVSNMGNVKSLLYNIKGNRKLTNSTVGYKWLWLDRKGVKTNFKVHRLVAKAFIPNPENKPFVNHINGIKQDNRVSNLEWVTPLENTRHAIKMGLTKYTEGKRIGKYSASGELIKEYKSLESASLEHFTDYRRLKRACVSGKILFGYYWKRL